MHKLSATEAGPRSSLKIKGIHKPVGKYVNVVTPRNYRLNADQVSTESCEEISRR
jgi:hypothetical protein